MQFSIPDPRAFAVYEGSPANPLIDLSLASLGAEVAVIAEKKEAHLREEIVAALIAGQTQSISDALARAPSLAVQRMLARTLAQAHVEAGRARSGETTLPTTVFALPIVVVAANAAPIQVPGALPNVGEFVELMKANGALRGNQTFTLSNALASVHALALEKLPSSLAWWQLETQSQIAVEKSSMQVPANQESVFLRFLIGSAIAGPGVDLLSEKDTGKWGMPFTQTFAKQLGGGSLSLLAMPRPPRTPLAALFQGRAAQREVSMQLFATNAIRKFRSSVGEPEAVISAHRTASGGEVRLSLSNAFDEKGAEGFRAELFATDRAQDIATAMQDLLRECNVEQVTVLADIFPDHDPETNLPWFFRADALEESVQRALRSALH
ncbi:MAG: hypothetical protein EAZ24_10245 [Burkholderiales bacterium]|nr:MAG: hypothetical protein EAZ24_10245 [Burkholderiales bacterium]TAG81460.1 MAG: hypothetical protein EAZ21_05920 [Betaproteobacteria bacterium]